MHNETKMSINSILFHKIKAECMTSLFFLNKNSTHKKRKHKKGYLSIARYITQQMLFKIHSKAEKPILVTYDA